MLSTTSLLVGGATLAIVGGVFLAGSLASPPDGAPAAAAVGAACHEAVALQDAAENAGAVLATRVSSPGFPDVEEDEGTYSDENGYGTATYQMDLPVEFDDARLSGTFSGEVLVQFLEDDAGLVDAVVTIRNDAGAWVGDLYGSSPAEPASDDDWMTTLADLTGSGDYAGCSAALQFIGSRAEGFIYPTAVREDK